MSSLEEDALFESHGWLKNLIARRWESPRGLALGFDDLVGLTETTDSSAKRRRQRQRRCATGGEDTLRQLVAVYGEAQG